MHGSVLCFNKGYFSLSIGLLTELLHSMNSQILGLRVAGTVFGLMALAQMLRLVIRPDVLVAGHAMPLWPNEYVE